MRTLCPCGAKSPRTVRVIGTNAVLFAQATHRPGCFKEKYTHMPGEATRRSAFRTRVTTCGGRGIAVAESQARPDSDRSPAVAKVQVTDSRQVDHVEVWLTTQGTAA